MRIRNEPAPPPVKFAGMVLYQATERNTNEVRLARDEEKAQRDRPSIEIQGCFESER